MTRKLNALYRAKTGYGHVEPKYGTNDKVKFIKYLGKSAKGGCRIKYELLNFKGEVIDKGNKFRKCDIDWNIQYIIKTA